MSGGGRFDFDDGGTYCGGWEDGKAHGHGVCTGPKGQGEYSGAWLFGFEASGVYTWPSGNNYTGEWTQGKRHGVGVETKGAWVYKGEWTQGFKGRYGIRQSTSSGAKYEGTWTTGLQDGYGVETYADGGMYQGQWLRGMRHGYGVRASVPYGLASHYRPKTLRASLTSLRSEKEEDNVVKDRDRKIDESRGGFVLQARSDESPAERRRSLFDKQGRSSLRKSLLSGLKLRKQKSTGDIQDSPRRPTGSIRSTISNISHTSADSAQTGVTHASMCTNSDHSFVSQDDITDINVTETYMGEWKNDKRSGFGISERSDGLKYEGEWYNNKKYGYGVTTSKEGNREEGKYKNNILISSGKKSKLFLIRSSKLKERVANAVGAAQRAAQIALQKADIAMSRMANARAKSEQADMAANKAQQDSDLARIKAKEFAPEFHQPGTDIIKKHQDLQPQHDNKPTQNHIPYRSKSHMDRHTTPPLDQDPYLNENRPGNQNPVSGLLSSTLDCAIGGSSTNIMQSLNKYDERQPRQPNAVPPGIRINNPHGVNGGNTGPMNPQQMNKLQQQQFLQQQQQQLLQQQQQQQQQNFVQQRNPKLNYNTRQYSSDTERPYTPDEPMPFRERGVRGNGAVRGNFNPGMSKSNSDRFDHYSTPDREMHRDRDDSGLGRDLDSPEEHFGQPMYPTDRSPDSGLSDIDDIRNKPLQRRKTLPSIMKRVPSTKEMKKTRNVKDPVHSLEHLPPEASETYIIENGIRKRVQAEVYAQPPPSATLPQGATMVPGAESSKRTLPSRYKLESQSPLRRGGANRGSLPDVTACRELKQSVMPREEASKLSSQRRAELVKLQEEAERRRQQEIVLRLTDLKDWCQQRQLLMLVIALNVSLATMFFNLLSQ